MLQYIIAGFKVQLILEKWIKKEYLEQFARSFEAPDLIIRTFIALPPDFPRGTMLSVKSNGHNVYSYDGITYFKYDYIECSLLIEIDINYNNCNIYLHPNINSDENPDIYSIMSELVFDNIRRIITGKMALNQGVLIHSSVIKWHNKSILFSAVSGTGKSTHAHLWQEVYEGVEIVNGDNGFCRIKDGKPYIFGAPWCGTSRECLNETLPIKGIVFLEQAKENSIERLDKLESFMRLSTRCFLPFWDDKLISNTMETVEYVSQNIPCFLLKCLPDHDAVKLVRECIEK